MDHVVSRVPHAAVRLRGLKPEHRFMLAEEREPRWYSLAAIPPDISPDVEPWFFALNRSKRAETGGLTLILRRFVVSEFPVLLEASD